MHSLGIHPFFFPSNECLRGRSIYISIFVALAVLNVIQPESRDMELWVFRFGGWSPLEAVRSSHVVWMEPPCQGSFLRYCASPGN